MTTQRPGAAGETGGSDTPVTPSRLTGMPAHGVPVVSLGDAVAGMTSTVPATSPAYYNENDPFAAQWLRNLIAAGLLPAGDVDARSIVDVRPDDVRGYGQCHFFAGIGGWAYALHLAGWGDEPVWTGSCPCQPFSVAGSGAGEGDERHLWPEFRRLIAECRPRVVFGEQVDGEDGELWLAGVQIDLEAISYRIGPTVLPAASVGAPHGRHRIYWVADAVGSGRDGWPPIALGEPQGRIAAAGPGEGGGSGLADTDSDGPRRARGAEAVEGGDGQDGRLHRGSADGGLGYADYGRCQQGHRGIAPGEPTGADCRPEPQGPWADTYLIDCGDGRTRRAPSGIQLLAPRVSGCVDIPRPGETDGPEIRRVNAAGALMGFGNAIVPAVAAEFVAAYRDCAGVAEVSGAGGRL